MSKSDEINLELYKIRREYSPSYLVMNPEYYYKLKKEIPYTPFYESASIPLGWYMGYLIHLDNKIEKFKFMTDEEFEEYMESEGK